MKHNIFVKNKEKNYECLDSKNLMDSLSVVPGLVPDGCHSGGCGLCKIKVYEGLYKKIKMSRKHISQIEEEQNIVLACRVFPTNEMEIEFISKPKPKLYTLGN